MTSERRRVLDVVIRSCKLHAACDMISSEFELALTGPESNDNKEIVIPHHGVAMIGSQCAWPGRISVKNCPPDCMQGTLKID
jgi:hypothetical protein